MVGNRSLCSLLYADDIVLTADTAEELQSMIDEVAAYTSQWRLSLNTSKNQIMVVRPSAGNTPPVEGGEGENEGEDAEAWTFRGRELAVVREYKYLGVWFTDKLLWDRHIKHVLGKAKKKLQPLRRLFAQRQLPMTIKRQVFTALVRTTMEYASAVWFCNSAQEKLLESVQHLAAS